MLSLPHIRGNFSNLYWPNSKGLPNTRRQTNTSIAGMHETFAIKYLSAVYNPAGQRSGGVPNGARGAGRRVKPFCRKRNTN